MPDQALSHIRVLDFTQHLAGPYCTKLMADQGADVIKVERPGIGDVARRLGPFPGDAPHPEKSGLFLHLNTNKRGITLDLAGGPGRDIARQLVAEADLVVESFRPGTMASFGLDYPALKAVNPDLVMTSISNFGQTGPYRDYRGSDIIFYAMGGEMSATGLPEREPLKLGPNATLYQAGAAAAVATMGALFLSCNPNDGQPIGQHVDVSIMETQLSSVDRRMTALLAYQYAGKITGREDWGFAGYPHGVFPCLDGYFAITGAGVYFSRTVEMIGSPEALQDPKFHSLEAQTDPGLQEEFEEVFYPWILSRTKLEVWEAAQKAQVLGAPLNTMEEVLNMPFFEERGSFAHVDHPEAGPVTQPGRPFVMNETPWALRRPAPLLGQHNQEVLAELGYTPADVDSLRQSGAI